MKLFAHCPYTKIHLWDQKSPKSPHRNPLKSGILDSVLCSIHPMKWPPVTAVAKNKQENIIHSILVQYQCLFLFISTVCSRINSLSYFWKHAKFLRASQTIRRIKGCRFRSISQLFPFSKQVFLQENSHTYICDERI